MANISRIRETRTQNDGGTKVRSAEDAKPTETHAGHETDGKHPPQLGSGLWGTREAAQLERVTEEVPACMRRWGTGRPDSDPPESKRFSEALRCLEGYDE